uniref:Sodium/calcium exchanger membrane region domain-containing protein n=1 Tax=Ditylum brightwellii TaxID=49249 RepID=A0A7S4R3X5_9STRA
MMEEEDTNKESNGITLNLGDEKKDDTEDFEKEEKGVRLLGNGSSNKHAFQTKVALTLSLCTLVPLVLLSVVFGSSDSYGARDGHHRWLDDIDSSDEAKEDYSGRSCGDIFAYTASSRDDQCTFARNCNGGDGIFAPFVFCNHSLPVMAWFGILSPLLAVWLVTLFRMLGSTAEDFFSPSLEMFSLKMGLPPRFAGVTLLALGNGAADVSATINAIKSDPQTGYQMSLGALTGAGMFVGTVVCGVVIVTADGVACRGALVRDVVVFIITVAVVFWQLKRGSIGPTAITLFFSMYILFVLIVFIADVYHRAVVVPRMERLRDQRERERQRLEGQEAQQAAAVAVDNLVNDTDVATTEMAVTHNAQNLSTQNIPGANTGTSPRQNKALNKVLMALSNYDKYETQGIEDPLDGMSGWGIDGNESQTERPIVLHGTHGILNKHNGGGNSESIGTPDRPLSPNIELIDSPYHAMTDDPIDGFCTETGYGSFSAHNWKGAWHDGTQELKVHFRETWKDIFVNEENGILDKFFLACELPFTLFRKFSVPIPCEGYYCRALVALSIFLSPIWIGVYLLIQHDINLFLKSSIPYILIGCVPSFIIGALVLRYAPGGEGVMGLNVSVPIAFYGFVIAATWIDAIADQLVSLLVFFGAIFRIPGSIMGLTVLAWGNSMGDLSANMTMAKKGLANMAITACFAGPVFNILIGLGGGFSTLSKATGNAEAEVVLSPSISIGFFFLLCNCILVLVSGVILNKGMIPKSYGYAALALYLVYLIVSITVQFTTK